jgi:hypothetical protein
MAPSGYATGACPGVHRDDLPKLGWKPIRSKPTAARQAGGRRLWADTA